MKADPQMKSGPERQTMSPAERRRFAYVRRAAAENRRFALIFFSGTLLLLLGLLLGQEESVLRKAIFLCLECIGIG